MLNRRLYPVIEQALERFPAVALLGPRQAGKTTLARAITADRAGSLYIDLERPSDLAKLADPELFLSRHIDQLVVLDEIQRRPELFSILRALIDDNRLPGDSCCWVQLRLNCHIRLRSHWPGVSPFMSCPLLM